MHIKFISTKTREARLANRRLVLMKSFICTEPDKNMDLIFHRGHGKVFGFKLRETHSYKEIVFTASKKRIDEESKACGHKSEDEKRAWLENIKTAEAKLWQAWMDGEVYNIFIEHYDESERQFIVEEGRYELYGFEDMIDNLKDMLAATKIDVACVDPDCGDPKDWKDEYREFDID